MSTEWVYVVVEDCGGMLGDQVHHAAFRTRGAAERYVERRCPDVRERHWWEVIELELGSDE